MCSWANGKCAQSCVTVASRLADKKWNKKGTATQYRTARNGRCSLPDPESEVKVPALSFQVQATFLLKVIILLRVLGVAILSASENYVIIMTYMNDPEWQEYDQRRQRNYVQGHLYDPLRKGDEWYLVAMPWFKRFKRFLRFPLDDRCVNTDLHFGSNPGQIDLSPLLARDGVTLKTGLRPEVDYVLVPQGVWGILLGNYGLRDRQPILCRRVVEHEPPNGYLKVEVYPLQSEFQLKRRGDPEEGRSVTYSFSHNDTLLKVKQVMRELFGIPANSECHIWHRGSTEPAFMDVLLKNENKELRELGLYSGTMSIEYWQSGGTWEVYPSPEHQGGETPPAAFSQRPRHGTHTCTLCCIGFPTPWL